MRLRFVVCASVLCALLVLGCQDGGSGAGGSGGAAGTGGTAGTGGMAGDGGAGGQGGSGGSVFACSEQGILDAIAEGGGPHTFDCDGPTILEASATITIDNDVTLDAGGLLTLDGQDALTLVEIAAGTTVTLRGVSFVRGLDSAVINEGALTLTDATISDSHAPGTGRGGCLAARGPLQATRVTFSGCSAFNAGALDMRAGPSVLDSVSFVGNFTNGNSGAAIAVDTAGDVTILNSTFSGNSTIGGGVGGAIGRFGGAASGRLSLRHNTFADNVAVGSGGAVFVGSESSIELEGNLFSGNSGATGSDVFVSASATLTSLGHNLLEDGSDSGIIDGVNGDIVGEAAIVGALADNGGATQTHAPAVGSPAIDAIPAGDCSVDSDQRGEDRPVGAGCDIGSVEQ